MWAVQVCSACRGGTFTVPPGPSLPAKGSSWDSLLSSLHQLQGPRSFFLELHTVCFCCYVWHLSEIHRTICNAYCILLSLESTCTRLYAGLCIETSKYAKALTSSVSFSCILMFISWGHWSKCFTVKYLLYILQSHLEGIFFCFVYNPG